MIQGIVAEPARSPVLLLLLSVHVGCAGEPGHTLRETPAADTVRVRVATLGVVSGDGYVVAFPGHLVTAGPGAPVWAPAPDLDEGRQVALAALTFGPIPSAAADGKQLEIQFADSEPGFPLEARGTCAPECQPPFALWLGENIRLVLRSSSSLDSILASLLMDRATALFTSALRSRLAAEFEATASWSIRSVTQHPAGVVVHMGASIRSGDRPPDERGSATFLLDREHQIWLETLGHPEWDPDADIAVQTLEPLAVLSVEGTDGLFLIAARNGPWEAEAFVLVDLVRQIIVSETY